MAKIDREVAQDNFDAWCEAKKIRARKREQNEEFEDVIVSAIEEGDLIINEDNSITQKLTVPINDTDGNPHLEELNFVSRIKIGKINEKLKGVKATDGDGRIVAYVAALTEENKGVITQLDSNDFSVSSAIVMYFL